jgi:hypothetical protein
MGLVCDHRRRDGPRVSLSLGRLRSHAAKQSDWLAVNTVHSHAEQSPLALPHEDDPGDQAAHDVERDESDVWLGYRFNAERIDENEHPQDENCRQIAA